MRIVSAIVLWAVRIYLKKINITDMYLNAMTYLLALYATAQISCHHMCTVGNRYTTQYMQHALHKVIHIMRLYRL